MCSCDAVVESAADETQKSIAALHDDATNLSRAFRCHSCEYAAIRNMRAI